MTVIHPQRQPDPFLWWRACQNLLFFQQRCQNTILNSPDNFSPVQGRRKMNLWEVFCILWVDGYKDNGYTMSRWCEILPILGWIKSFRSGTPAGRFKNTEVALRTDDLYMGGFESLQKKKKKSLKSFFCVCVFCTVNQKFRFVKDLCK